MVGLRSHKFADPICFRKLGRGIVRRAGAIRVRDEARKLLAPVYGWFTAVSASLLLCAS